MSDDPYSKPIPNTDDPVMGPFWKAAMQQRLTAQQCTACGAWNFPALPICPACLEQALEWRDVTPRGKVFSHATYHRAFHPGFKEDLPYTVAIIEVPEGVRYTGRIAGPREGLAIGSEVDAVFVKATEDFTLPMWSLVNQPGVATAG
jgi:uncharacterized protein